jgi:membrane fusion protein (multidrug efflux system)
MIKGLHGNGIAILGLATLAVACHNAGQQPNALPAASISIYKVQQDSAVYYDLYPATVTALNVVELRGDVADISQAFSLRTDSMCRQGKSCMK